MMYPTEHERAEWLRCARAATAAQFHIVATVLSRAAAMSSLNINAFDACQSLYRGWLIDGF